MENEIEFIKQYFYGETKDFEISNIFFVEQKTSYFDNVNCYLIETKQNVNFYVFTGDVTYTNLYSIKANESLDEVYYKHIGFVAELTSKTVSNNFILDFSKDFCVFPIIDRKMNKICEQITLDKDSMQLKGIANQLRDCYLDLTSYLINKNKTKNPDFKQDNFKDNFSEFLNLIIPGHNSVKRRNTFNAIAKKGWDYNSELVHKDSITVFDVMTSLNILTLIVSITSNLLTGNNMPFNRIKCPQCGCESYKMKMDENSNKYLHVCDFCGEIYEVRLSDIVKTI